MRRIYQLTRGLLVFLLLFFISLSAYSHEDKNQITIGCLYAKSGFLSDQSMQLHNGLLFWKKLVNKDGGVYVKAYDKKVSVKFKCYNDRSDTSLVPSLVNRLINNKVNILVSDTSSLLTAPAIPVAQTRKYLLINPLGTSKKFYKTNNPYVVQTADLVTRYWSKSIANVLLKLNIRRIAILFDTNDFDGPQAQELKNILSQHDIKPVYYNGIPSKTSNYIVLLHKIASTKPQAVVELGYDPNDVSFLKDLSQSNYKFNFVYTIFPSIVPKEFSDLNVHTLAYTYNYATPPRLNVKKVNIGLTTNQFITKYTNMMGNKPHAFQSAGYITGLIIQKALADAKNLKQLTIRHTLHRLSGKIRTIGGTFKINKNGAQTGVITGIGQYVPKGENKLKLNIVYPNKYKTANAVYPAPKKSDVSK